MNIILKEKNASFIDDVNTRIEGNIAVVPRIGGDVEEDGSMEISGTLYTDIFRSATVNTSIIIGDRFNFQEKSPGSLPPMGKMQIYSSDEHNSRIVMVNSDGKVIDINPLQKRGDIMVYDSTENTTVRLPPGSHDQVLAIGKNDGNGLVWSTRNVKENLLLEPSDTYIKHLIVENENNNGQLITASFASVYFSIVKRKDSAFTVLSSSTIQFTETGNYHINIRLNVFIADTEQPSYFTDVANVEAILQSDTSGFADIHGTQMYGMIAGGVPGNNIVTLSTQTVLNVTAGTQFRVRIKEINSNNLTIRIKPNSSTFIAQKIKIDNDTDDSSEFIFSHGSVGLSQTITNTPSLVNLNTFVTKTNNLDSIASNLITFNKSGLRHVWGKITLSSSNLPANGNVRVKLALLKNSVQIDSSISQVSITVDSNGIITKNSGYTQALISFATNDTISMQVTVLSQSSVAVITLDRQSCSLGSILYSSNNTPSPSIWKKFDSRVLLFKNIPNNNYYDIPFDTNNVVDTSNFTYNTLYPGIIQCNSHGTYNLFLKCAVFNNSSQTLNSGLRILIDNGSGFQELLTGRTHVSIRPSLSQSLILNQLIHLQTNSLIKIQVLGSTDNLQIVADTATILLYRIENTISTNFGQNVFGSYYQYKVDSLVSQTTSVTLLPIITMTTIFIPAGKYRIAWEFDWNMNNTGQNFYSELHADAVNIDEYSDRPLQINTFKRSCNFLVFTFTAGIHTLEILVSCQTSNRVLSTKNIRLEIIRAE